MGVLSLEVFTITNNSRFPVELWYDDEPIAMLGPGQTSEHFEEPGTYQAREIIITIPPPKLFLEVVVTHLPGAVDNSYTVTRNIGNFLVEIEFEGSN
jgi:hypothetical protein